MPGTMPRSAEDATACQKQCADTQGCTHFSYWWIGKHCHLQDAYALRQTGRLGFTSGPFGCWDSLDKTKYIKKGESTFVHTSYKCAELGTLYTPLMGMSEHFSRKDPALEAVKKCRAYCASTKGCAYYTMVFPQRLCRMAGASAHKVTPYLGAVSGSPTCWAGEEHNHSITEEEAAALVTPEPETLSDEQPSMIMKTSLRQGMPSTWRPVPLAGAASLLLAGAAVAWGAVAVVRRVRRRRDLLPCGSRSRVAASEYAAVGGQPHHPLAAAE